MNMKTKEELHKAVVDARAAYHAAISAAAAFVKAERALNGEDATAYGEDATAYGTAIIESFITDIASLRDAEIMVKTLTTLKR